MLEFSYCGGCVKSSLFSSGHGIQDAAKFGWNVPDKVTHNWGTMVSNIQDHIGSLNWGYRTALQDKGVKYLNSLATFLDDHTIKVRVCGKGYCLRVGSGVRPGGHGKGRTSVAWEGVVRCSCSEGVVVLGCSCSEGVVLKV